MYLNEIELENTGPISLLHYHLPFNDDGSPKPVVFVGQNGSGKSILIAHIVSALLDAKGVAFSDREIDEGKVYKLRTATYIRHGESFSRASLKFSGGFIQKEIQLSYLKDEYADKVGSVPADQIWNQIENSDSSFYFSNFNSKISEIEKDFSSSDFPYGNEEYGGRCRIQYC